MTNDAAIERNIGTCREKRRRSHSEQAMLTDIRARESGTGRGLDSFIILR